RAAALAGPTSRCAVDRPDLRRDPRRIGRPGVPPAAGISRNGALRALLPDRFAPSLYGLARTQQLTRPRRLPELGLPGSDRADGRLRRRRACDRLPVHALRARPGGCMRVRRAPIGALAIAAALLAPSAALAQDPLPTPTPTPPAPTPTPTPT